VNDYPKSVYRVLKLAQKRTRLIDLKSDAEIEDGLSLCVPLYMVEVTTIPHDQLWDVRLVLTESGKDILEAPSEGGKIPLEGEEFEEKDVPQAFRENGKLDGAVLTGPYLRKATEWDLRPAYLSKNYGDENFLTTYIKVGHAKAYLFTQVAALRVRKTVNQSRRKKD